MGQEQSTLTTEEEIEKYAEIERQKPSRRPAKTKDIVDEDSRNDSMSVASELEPGEVTEKPASAEPIAIPLRSLPSSQAEPAANDILASFNPRKEKEPKANTTVQELNPDEFREFMSGLAKPEIRQKPSSHETIGGRPSQPDGGKPAQQPTKQPTKLPLEPKSDSTNPPRRQTNISLPSKATNSSEPLANINGAPTTSTKRLVALDYSKASANGAASSSSNKRPAPVEQPKTQEKPTLSALSGLGKIPKRSSMASPQSPDRAESDELSEIEQERLPKWYQEIKANNARNKNDAGIDSLLNGIRTQISNAKRYTVAQNQRDLHNTFNDIRHKLHTVIFQVVNPQVLKNNRMLHDQDGLPQLFDPKYSSGVAWPYDIRADAKELYNKWCRKVFDTDIMRGIKFSLSGKGAKKEGGGGGGVVVTPLLRGTKVLSRRKDMERRRWSTDSGGLSRSVLFEMEHMGEQIVTVLDQSLANPDSVTQGGIYGKPGEGAYIVILSGGENKTTGEKYPDEDYGNEVLYCGTDSDNGELTAYTQRMLESVDNEEPVRLIRSHNAHTQYAPEAGFRYDGLYQAVSFEQMDAESSKRQRHRFRLIRLPNQDPIRGGNGPKKRPTKQEVDEYLKHQRNSGKMKGPA